MPDKTLLRKGARGNGDKVRESPGWTPDRPGTSEWEGVGRQCRADDGRTPRLSKRLLAEAGGVKPSEYIPWARARVG